MLIANAFSLNMLPSDSSTVTVAPISTAEVAKILLDEGVSSFVGHQNTADDLSAILGARIAMCRGNLKLLSGQSMIVAQYSGPRLAEGVSALPMPNLYRFLLVTATTT